MLVTVVANVGLVNNPFTYSGILLVALIVCLIIKEIVSCNPDPRIVALHRSLQVAWVPLAMTAAVVFGQHLYHLGIL